MHNVPIKNPISRRIFREQNDEVALVDTINEDDKKISLSEIIMKHQAQGAEQIGKKNQANRILNN